MLYSISLLILLLALMLFSIAKCTIFKISGLPKWMVALAFLFKLFLGFCIFWIYTNYYTSREHADIFKYFDDAVSLQKASEGNWPLRVKVMLPETSRDSEFQELIEHTQHWDRNLNEPYNDNPTIIRINFLFLLFSNGFYAIHALIFAFLSFLGSMALLRFLQSQSNVHPHLALILCCYVPSVIFWSSGILKESWLLFCLGFFLYFFQRLLKHFKIRTLALFLLSGYLLIQIKPYFALALAPGLVFYGLDYRINGKRSIPRFIIVHLLAVALVILFYGENVLDAIGNKKAAFIQLAVESNANSLYDTANYSNVVELLAAIPQSIFATLFRPSLLEINGALSALSAIENTLYLLFLFLPFFAFKAPNKARLRMALFSLSLVIILASIIGLGTPVLGAVVRYKTPLIPFYLIAVFTFVDLKKFGIKSHDE